MIEEGADGLSRGCLSEGVIRKKSRTGTLVEKLGGNGTYGTSV